MNPRQHCRISVRRWGEVESDYYNELLKEPIFEIREMDAQSVKKLEDEIMEALY